MTTCNLCGHSCKLYEDEYGENYGGLLNAVAQGGYYSTAGNGFGALDDLTAYKFSLCEFCLDWLFSHFKVPVETYNDYTGDEGYIGWRPAVERINSDEDWRSDKKTFFEEFHKRNNSRKI